MEQHVSGLGEVRSRSLLVCVENAGKAFSGLCLALCCWEEAAGEEEIIPPLSFSLPIK